MDNRKTIDEKILILIPIEVKYYKGEIYWRDILDISGIKLDDKIHDIVWKEEKQNTFGYDDEDEKTVMVPKLFVTRKRKETDKEYLKRKREEENQNKINEERDKLEYLRLKVKYEKK